MEQDGWRLFGFDEALHLWAVAASEKAAQILNDPQHANWYRYQDTWFVGVDCLDNDSSGQWPGGPPLAGKVVEELPALPLHRAQISAVFPGYPLAEGEESPAAARYRRTRDGAHVDGLLPIGPARRRMMREPHAYILGIPLTRAGEGASPLVVWEGSHRVMREAFKRVLGEHPQDVWHDVDLTDDYHEARRRVFKTCRRVEIVARPGEAVLLDPMLLHGIAPWRSTQDSPRIIAYFRPVVSFEMWMSGSGAQGLVSSD